MMRQVLIVVWTCLCLLACFANGQEESITCASSPENYSFLVDGVETDPQKYCLDSCKTVSDEESEPDADPEENLALAFGLVTAAGLSTTLGAALVFWDRFFTLANNSLLGAALGFSGGVMLYVSFVEIFQKSVADFETCECLWDGADEEDSAAYVVATLCFFGGVVITYSMDFLVHKISKCAGHGHSHNPPEISSQTMSSKNQGEPNVSPLERTDSPVNELVLEDSGSSPKETEEPKAVRSSSFDDNETDEEKKKLKHMGSMTALAIGLHNFPEGLATFVATLGDPAVGVALTVAIAIHNIPEGLCVSIPVYYATGSRWKGFCMAFWSGVTEIIGAALGYAFLKEILGPAAYAALFGVVSGMMVTIVLKELLPTAHRYDPADKYVTNSVFVGAFIMALSLVLFVL